jgi:RNA polymerase sigma-70 factor (ECF subfamily)
MEGFNMALEIAENRLPPSTARRGQRRIVKICGTFDIEEWLNPRWAGRGFRCGMVPRAQGVKLKMERGAMALDQSTIVKALLSERVKVLAYIVSLVRQRELAEDIFQDVCLLALQRPQDIRDLPHLLAWMRVTARFKSLNALRKGRKETLHLSDAVMDLLDVRWQEYDQISSSRVLDFLHACLKTLTQKARNLLQERYAEGVSMEEIARRLDRPVASVYVTLSRAHQALSDCVFQKLGRERGGGYV